MKQPKALSLLWCCAGLLLLAPAATGQPMGTPQPYLSPQQDYFSFGFWAFEHSAQSMQRRDSLAVWNRIISAPVLAAQPERKQPEPLYVMVSDTSSAALKIDRQDESPFWAALPELKPDECLIQDYREATYRVEKVAIEKRPERRFVIAVADRTARRGSPETITIPGEYVMVDQQVAVAEPSIRWVPVRCSKVFTPDVIRQVQQALAQNGHYKGSADGVYGGQTEQSVAAYKRAHGIAGDGLSYETLAHLGLDVAVIRGR